MKGKVGIFLAGVVAGLLLDPESGEKRRTMVASRLEPLRKRAMRARDQAMASDTMQDTTQTAEDAAQTAQSVASGAMSRVAGAVKGAMGRGPSGGSSATGNGAAGAQATGPDYTDPATAREELTPNGRVPDPIPEGTPNDPTLVARVESELFSDDRIPKGKLNLDAVDGVVTLRGTVDAAMAADVIARTRAIDGVVEVVDMLQRA